MTDRSPDAQPHVPRIALTPGEPAGIGPDLCIQLAQRRHQAALVAFADPAMLAERAVALGLPLRLADYDPLSPPAAQAAGSLTVAGGHRLRTPAVAGRLDPRNAGYVVESLGAACHGCLTGEFDAMVTAPVHKGVINDAGFVFTGHTEFLADICEAKPVMMLATPGLRVALATTHVPLAAVSATLTTDLLHGVLQILLGDLERLFRIEKPRVAVCGLNPHAGEGGHLGREEIEVIQPVLERFRAEGADLIGPLPADTLFLPRTLVGVDAVLAMYHDQGLPVLKHVGFGDAVNLTLGLPIIRTSVDHGTALDLAGGGGADVGSLQAALTMAIDLAASAAS